MKRRHVPPSRLRYEERNPAITFRVPIEQQKKLADIRRRTGHTISQILREGLGLVEVKAGDAYNRGFKDGLGRFEAPCSICGKPLEFDIKKESDAKAVLLKAFADWCHGECKEEPGSTD
jgi:hypothetical protein